MTAKIVPIQRTASPDPHDSLPELRNRIDALDEELLELLGRRVSLCRALGQLKTEEGRPVLDPQREAQVVASAARRARAASIPEEGVRTLFWSVLALSRSAQVESP
ncbi:MAG: chorismate mutase [Gemmatimonadota bacterium]